MITLLVSGALGSDESTAVPASREPFHHLVFENEFIRVLDVHIPPQSTTRYHIHAYPLVGAVIDEMPTWEQVLGAPQGPTGDPEPRGTLIENWSRQLPYTHRVHNQGGKEVHYVVAEIVKPAGTPEEATPETTSRKMVKESQYARVYSITIPPGGSTEARQHAAPGLTIQVDDGPLSLTEDGPSASGGSGAGAWYWRKAGSMQSLTNKSDHPVRVMEIDLR